MEQNALQEQLLNKLTRFQPDHLTSLPVLIQKAIFLAGELQRIAPNFLTEEERRLYSKMEPMIANPHDKAVLIQMTDQAFRSSNMARIADQLIHILKKQGIPRFFSVIEQFLFKIFESMGDYFPNLTIPIVMEIMRRETSSIIIPAEKEGLLSFLRGRQTLGLRMNINSLGEALLGEREAERRLNLYRELLSMPETEVISVKISTLYSQISPLARNHTISVLCDRLEQLYRDAAGTQFVQADGTTVQKFATASGFSCLHCQLNGRTIKSFIFWL